MSDTRADLRKRGEWLADVIAGLQINGIRRSEITVRLHSGLAITVLVRGAPKYEWPAHD